MAGRKKQWVAGHPKARKKGRCPRCGAKHDRSAHWSHKANTGEKSYKHSATRKRKYKPKVAVPRHGVSASRGGAGHGAAARKRGKSTSGRVAVPRSPAQKAATAKMLADKKKK